MKRAWKIQTNHISNRRRWDLDPLQHLTSGLMESVFRLPHPVHCSPGSPHLAHVTSSLSELSSLSPSITSSVFHSSLKTHLFHKSFPSSSAGSFTTASHVGLTALGPDSLLIGCFVSVSNEFITREWHGMGSRGADSANQLQMSCEHINLELRRNSKAVSSACEGRVFQTVRPSTRTEPTSSNVCRRRLCWQ